MKKNKKDSFVATKPVQYLTAEYIERTRHATPDQIVKFLEDGQKLLKAKGGEASTLISIRIPDVLLSTFKSKAELEGVKYQTLIKKLMADYIRARK